VRCLSLAKLQFSTSRVSRFSTMLKSMQ
jgi:hypothetical protein